MADPVIINPSLTLAGQAAAFNADSVGIELKITHVSFGRAHYDPTGNEVALVDPVGSKIPVAGGSRPTPYQLRITSAWREDVGTVPVGEIAWWAGNVLVFVWSKANGQVAVYKTDGTPYVMFNDLAFTQVPGNSISFTIDPLESVALAALTDHEGSPDAHPQYMLREDMAYDSGPLAYLSTTSSTANALILKFDTLETALPSLRAGQRFQFLAPLTNTGAVTAKVEDFALIAVKRGGDTGLVDLEAGDIKAGSLYDLNYDGTFFQLGGGVGSGKAFERYSFVASVAQAEFIAPHIVGSAIVLRNGREITEFTSAANGSKITLATPCNLGDSLEILAFKSFKVADSYTKAEITALLTTAGGLPVGAMLPFPRGVVPPGFLEVNGSAFNPAVYPDLAAFLGGSTLPESRGEFLRGWDHGRGVDIGREIGTLQSDLTKAHSHGILVDNTAGTSFGSNGVKSSAGGLLGGVTRSMTSNTDSNVGTETRPRNLSVMWCIKAWNAPINQGTIDIAALSVLAAQATELAQGTAKVATQTQTDAGADDATIVTPKKLRWGFQILKARNGYIVFPSWLGGLIIQWGTIIGTTGDLAFPYPIGFPNAVLQAVVSMSDKTTGALAGITPYVVEANISKTTLNVRVHGSDGLGTSNARYIAIGH
jgi:hypothetical protein